jgi:hypothetical protein
MKHQMLTVPGCKIQQLFVSCMKENISLVDITHAPIKQRKLVGKELVQQNDID